MAILHTLKGPDVGRQYTLEPATIILGRQLDSTICLEAQAVSRHHARIVRQDGSYFVEDLQSSNGTFVNGKRVRNQVPFNEGDTLQVGPYFFTLRQEPAPPPPEEDVIIRGQVTADPAHFTLHGQDPAHKLKVVLEIAQHLSGTLETDAVLGKVLEHLMGLFPQADRGMVLLWENDQPIVRAQRSRHPGDDSAFPFSRTVVQQAMLGGVGILSEDARTDQRFKSSNTLSSLDLRSLMCVPLISSGSRRLGVVQMDSSRPGNAFQLEDLQVLTAVGLQVAVVLENAELHAQLLKEERLRQELALAQEIQQGFLPTRFPSPEEHGFELFARVASAREVSGDFYDFFFRPDGRLAFFVGDVSGKGIPAALYMVAVRSLSRHLGMTGETPAATLAQLNTALAADNQSGMFVTLIHGLYRPQTGELAVAVGGHPAPLLRRADGRVETLHFPSGQFLGYQGGEMGWKDSFLTLAPKETVIFYTDGFTEAYMNNRAQMFGLDNLREAVGGPRTQMSLAACCDEAFAAVERFRGTAEGQDDLTLFLLRRVRT
jgi:serine phosphatase RsbU (regulator of sigma subunit)